MDFLDNSGHIFTLPSYSSEPIGYEFEENEYVFWCDDPNTKYLSINNYYIKVINFIVYYDNMNFNNFNDLVNVEITLESTKFWLLNPQQIQEMVNNNQSIHDYIQLHEDYFSSEPESMLKRLTNDDLIVLTLNQTDENDDKYMNSWPRSNMAIIPLYVVTTSREEGSWLSNILIHVSNAIEEDDVVSETWCPITVGGAYNEESEILTINGQNMGISLPKDIFRAVYQSSFLNEEFNEQLYNEKLKEYLLNYIPLKVEVGNYNSVEQSLKWFGYGDKITLSKLLRNDNRIKTQFVHDYFNISTDMLNSFKYFSTRALISLRMKANEETNKTNGFDLSQSFWGEDKPVMKDLFNTLERVEVGYSDDKWSYLKPYYDFTFYELSLKLACLKYYYEKYFLPIHLKIQSATIAHQVFTNDIKMHNYVYSTERTESPINIENSHNFNSNADSIDEKILPDVTFETNKLRYFTNQKHFIDDNFNEFKDIDPLHNDYYKIEDTCLNIPIHFNNYNKLYNCVLLLEKVLKVNEEKNPYRLKINDYPINLFYYDLEIKDYNDTAKSLNLEDFMYSFLNYKENKYGNFIQGYENFKEYLKSYFTIKLSSLDDVDESDIDYTSRSIFFNEDENLYINLSNNKFIENINNKLTYDQCELFYDYIGSQYSDFKIKIEDEPIELITKDFYIYIPQLNAFEFNVMNQVLENPDIIGHIIVIPSVDLLVKVNMTEINDICIIRNKYKKSIKKSININYIPSSNLIYESHFSFIQKEDKPSTQYNCFVLYPKLLNDNNVNYFVNQNYILRLLVNNKWYTYTFESKIPDLYLDFGKINYKYWYNSDNYFSRFSQLQDFEPNKYDDNGNLTEQGRLVFNSYMHNPDLVNIDSINFSSQIEKYIITNNITYIDQNQIYNCNFEKFISFNKCEIYFSNYIFDKFKSVVLLQNDIESIIKDGERGVFRSRRVDDDEKWDKNGDYKLTSGYSGNRNIITKKIYILSENVAFTNIADDENTDTYVRIRIFDKEFFTELFKGKNPIDRTQLDRKNFIKITKENNNIISLGIYKFIHKHEDDIKSIEIESDTHTDDFDGRIIKYYIEGYENQKYDTREEAVEVARQYDENNHNILMGDTIQNASSTYHIKTKVNNTNINLYQNYNTDINLTDNPKFKNNIIVYDLYEPVENIIDILKFYQNIDISTNGIRFKHTFAAGKNNTFVNKFILNGTTLWTNQIIPDSDYLSTDENIIWNNGLITFPDKDYTIDSRIIDKYGFYWANKVYNNVNYTKDNTNDIIKDIRFEAKEGDIKYYCYFDIDENDNYTFYSESKTDIINDYVFGYKDINSFNLINNAYITPETINIPLETDDNGIKVDINITDTSKFKDFIFNIDTLTATYIDAFDNTHKTVKIYYQLEYFKRNSINEPYVESYLNNSEFLYLNRQNNNDEDLINLYKDKIKVRITLHIIFIDENLHSKIYIDDLPEDILENIEITGKDGNKEFNYNDQTISLSYDIAMMDERNKQEIAMDNPTNYSFKYNVIANSFYDIDDNKYYITTEDKKKQLYENVINYINNTLEREGEISIWDSFNEGKDGVRVNEYSHSKHYLQVNLLKYINKPENYFILDWTEDIPNIDKDKYSLGMEIFIERVDGKIEIINEKGSDFILYPTDRQALLYFTINIFEQNRYLREDDLVNDWDEINGSQGEISPDIRNISINGASIIPYIYKRELNYEKKQYNYGSDPMNTQHIMNKYVYPDQLINLNENETSLIDLYNDFFNIGWINQETKKPYVQEVYDVEKIYDIEKKYNLFKQINKFKYINDVTINKNIIKASYKFEKQYEIDLLVYNNEDLYNEQLDKLKKEFTNSIRILSMNFDDIVIEKSYKINADTLETIPDIEVILISYEIFQYYDVDSFVLDDTVKGSNYKNMIKYDFSVNNKLDFYEVKLYSVIKDSTDNIIETELYIEDAYLEEHYIKLISPKIELSSMYLDYDLYLMHDTNYWYIVFISKETISKALKPADLKVPKALKILYGEKYRQENNIDIKNKYINNTDYELRYVGSDDEFLINRMQYVSNEGINHFNQDDVIVGRIQNCPHLPVNIYDGTKWHIKPISSGMKKDQTIDSNSEMCLLSLPKNDNKYQKGYYDIDVRYCLDRNINHQVMKKGKLRIG